MSTRDWLREALEQEVREAGPTDSPEPAWFEATLDAAIGELGLSDRSIDLLLEVADPAELTQPASRGVLASDPSVEARRRALGMSSAEAAAIVGVSPDVYETLERAPLRWPNVTSVANVGRLLARLGIQPAAFVRWLAAMRPAASGYAWGYRPGTVADRPVETDPDQAHFFAWGEQLLRQSTPALSPSEELHVLGAVWSPSVAAERAGRILSAAQARLLAIELRYEPPIDSITASVIAFPTKDAMVYPAFQFSETGTLIPIVGEINELLGADTDPWGVADWWLGEESFLGARPVDLVAGSESDHARLRSVARDLIEGD